MLREVKAGYDVRGKVRVNHLLYMDDLKLHGKNEKQIQHSKAYRTRATFVFQTQRHLCLRKCCPCALVKDRDFCVSKVVGEIKHVKSGKNVFQTQDTKNQSLRLPKSRVKDDQA